MASLGARGAEALAAHRQAQEDEAARLRSLRAAGVEDDCEYVAIDWDARAHDVVTEMAIALQATGVKCDVHHVAEKDAQRFMKVGPSVAQNRQRQPGERQPSQPAAALLAAARSVSDIAL